MNKLLANVPVKLILFVAVILIPLLWFDAVLAGKMDKVQKTQTDALVACSFLKETNNLGLVPEASPTASVKTKVPVVSPTRTPVE